MSHFGRSGTVLDTPDTLVSVLNLTTLYCYTEERSCRALWHVRCLRHAGSCPCCLHAHSTHGKAKEPPAISLQYITAVSSRGDILRYVVLSTTAAAAHFMCVVMCE